MPYPIPFLLLLFFIGTKFSAPEVIYDVCSDDHYDSASPFESNLRRLLTNITASAPKSPILYSALSFFEVFGFAECRPDASPVACTDCLLESFSRLAAGGGSGSDGCGQSKSAAVYQDLCLLRYSNKNFLNSLDENAVGHAHSVKQSTNPADFSRRVAELMGHIAWEAASNASAKFAVGVAEAGGPLKQKIYGMVWCTRDLTDGDCFQCLLSGVPKLSYTTLGGRIFRMSCLLRFEVYVFFNPAFIKPQHNLATLVDVGAGAGSSAGGGQGKSSKTEGCKAEKLLLVVILEGVALAVSSLIFIVLLLRKGKKLILPTRHDADKEDMRKEKSLLLDFGIISASTGHFSKAYMLGEGGFGPVYKGVLKDGEEIAVKRLSTSSGQGVNELKNEVVFVARLQHRNLVRLLGCCLEKDEKLLVYEFLPNTSLDKHLFDPVRKIQLDWGTRFKIIEGIAQGLLYLHEDSRVRVIHCDLKASNILLDGNMNPKISDFGLAKLFGIHEAQRNTSRIAGTYGYMAPEYALRGSFSTKSDVYSYGVLVLEIVTGQRTVCLDETVDYVDLLRFVWQNWKEGQALQAVDQTLEDRFVPKQALRCLQIGLLCIQEDPAQRPSMASLVVMLSSNSFMLPEPLIPAFLR